VTALTCVRCGRPTPDGNADVVCGVTRPRGQLAEIVEMLPAARDVAHGLARHGGGGGASGKPGSRLPINLAAAAKLDAVQGVLTTWVRHVAEERGVNLAEINGDGLTWLSSSRVGVDQAQAVLGDLGASAEWLGGHCEWMRHRPECDEWLADVEAAVRVIRGVARGPGEQKYLGPCGADLIAQFAEGLVDAERCEGDVYGWAGAEKGTCRTCGAQVVQAERRAWLDGQVADRAYRAAHIAGAYGISVNTIRSWALRGRLIEHGHDGDGRPLYLIGDVLQLAREAAARRAEAEAKRARREAAEMGA
jgi:hypothetical protein